MTLVVAMASSLLLLLLGLNTRRQRKIAKLEKQVVHLQKKIEIAAKFLCEYAILQENARAMINRIRAKDDKLGEGYEQMMKEGQLCFNNLYENLFTEEELSKTLCVNIEFELFTHSDRLLLIMLTNDISNVHIAALLNINLINLKHRKYYLKRKIEKNATIENNFIVLLLLLVLDILIFQWS